MLKSKIWKTFQLILFMTLSSFLLISYSEESEPGASPSKISVDKRKERRIYAQKMFLQNPDLFPEGRRQSILDGIVSLGMTPFEAKLAGGAFVYKVAADKTKWSENADPLRVMWAQSVQADDSEIWMIFKNSSQYGNKRDVPFRVHFIRGHAISIEKLEEK